MKVDPARVLGIGTSVLTVRKLLSGNPVKKLICEECTEYFLSPKTYF